MNRTRIFVTLLGALFVASVGTGVIVGQVDEPEREIAVTDVVSTATTTTAAPTTTVAPTTTTTAAPTTTVAPTTTTTRRPVVTIPVTTAPVVTEPPTTAPPVTDPPTTTTTAIAYDPVKCANINTQFAIAGQYDDPARVALLKLNGCPPYYW